VGGNSIAPFSTNCGVLTLESIDAVQGSFWLRNFRILPKEGYVGTALLNFRDNKFYPMLLYESVSEFERDISSTNFIFQRGSALAVESKFCRAKT
jgi:hypothetical protein